MDSDLDMFQNLSFCDEIRLQMIDDIHTVFNETLAVMSQLTEQLNTSPLIFIFLPFLFRIFLFIELDLDVLPKLSCYDDTRYD